MRRDSFVSFKIPLLRSNKVHPNNSTALLVTILVLHGLHRLHERGQTIAIIIIYDYILLLIVVTTSISAFGVQCTVVDERSIVRNAE